MTYVDYLAARGRERDASLFSTILVDERRHADYTRALLFELAASEAEARRALRRVKRWEAWRGWLRAGRFLASRRDFRRGREAKTPLYRAYCKFWRQSPRRKGQARRREGLHPGLLDLNQALNLKS
ncbi:hypothetical protein ENSA5_06940 [Enhygromyxa salina]|uniref:Ferritin-like domain-containing protein n=1 Tax=Enhygromyxa salina TaxID=215803 RepID=A0A2S9YHE1_9BACT|nr:hypothetical protein [Enhygromyxa salina]PRQ04528.1 hypothetical protein ENSA5_06940 [Enhygromyxa salina]